MNLPQHDLAGLAWSQLWQVTALVVIVAGLTRFACRRRPHLAYLLWLLVVVKCLTPPLWSSPTGVFSWAQVQLADRPTEGGGNLREAPSPLPGETPPVTNAAERGTLFPQAAVRKMSSLLLRERRLSGYTQSHLPEKRAYCVIQATLIFRFRSMPHRTSRKSILSHCMPYAKS